MMQQLKNSRAIVVMGVCGSGKSHIGRLLAAQLGARFIEGDDFHPVENVRKMAAGQALDDADRAGWLGALADALRSAAQAGEAVVLSCSALKRSYRQVLATGAPFQLVVLHGSRALLFERVSARASHFMPASLLDSQLATLELPGSEETAIQIDIAPPAEQIVAGLCAQLGHAAATI
ncbi:gluconokinase [Chitinimonas taiwanensis]|uniref:gluconokinase n=1 Tax=Chitinimonas taiwanensis TaxID=240412 RepID=UPI0035B4DFCA